jgi:hypothetical protein
MGNIMTLLCRVLAHRIALPVSDNQGFAFSRCRRCGRDMIRSGGSQKSSDWRKVPAGFRVVWSGGASQESAPVAASDLTSGQPEHRAENACPREGEGWEPVLGDNDATAQALSMQRNSEFALHAHEGWNPNLAHDLLRIGGAALYWSARDALRALPRRRARVLRLPAG